MIIYNKRDEENGGDYFDVKGHYYSNPVQAALKAIELEGGEYSIDAVLTHLEVSNLRDLVRDEQSVREIAKYWKIEI